MPRESRMSWMACRSVTKAVKRSRPLHPGRGHCRISKENARCRHHAQERYRILPGVSSCGLSVLVLSADGPPSSLQNTDR